MDRLPAKIKGDCKKACYGGDMFWGRSHFHNVKRV
jgi:hypothetical protein